MGSMVHRGVQCIFQSLHHYNGNARRVNSIAEWEWQNYLTDQNGNASAGLIDFSEVAAKTEIVRIIDFKTLKSRRLMSFGMLNIYDFLYKANLRINTYLRRPKMHMSETYVHRYQPLKCLRF
jgi:hypothetical protein